MHGVYPSVKRRKERDVAQVVERLLWEQDVAGSSPVIPIYRIWGCTVSHFASLQCGIFQTDRRCGGSVEGA